MKRDATARSPWVAMILLAFALLLAMSVWFSAAAVLPALRSEWNLSDEAATMLTLAVQFGFVAGTLLSAFFNLPDVLSARHLLAVSAICASLTNAAFTVVNHGGALAFSLRFLTGVMLAGVYPPGMKVMASWFQKGRGMALGVLIGALTLGKAAPYLINAIGSANWRINLLAASGLAALSAFFILLFVSDGPFTVAGARFDPAQFRKIFGNRGVRLANFGYFGHMWELYAMWTWAPAMIRASFASRSASPSLAETTSFLVIGAGAIGCVLAGIVADRIGRTVVASMALIVSGACCLVIGFFFGAHPVLLIVIAVVWGISVVADSAQFSACVTELADRQYIGTALTLQTCIGFLLTTFSIHLIPIMVRQVGWRYAFCVLAVGPVFGVISMLRLRKLARSESFRRNDERASFL